MPITLSDIANRTREVSFMFDLGDHKEEVKAVYRPGWYTVEREEALKARSDANKDTNDIRAAEERAQRLSELLISWDVLDAKGKPYPTTYTALRSIDSTGFLGELESAIVRDLYPNRQTGETSAGTS